MGNLRETQNTVEAVIAPSTKNLRVTQDSVEVLRVSADLIATQRTTQDTLESLQGGNVRTLRVTQDTLEVLVNAVPFELNNFNNNLLLYVLTHHGPSPWSTFSAFPINKQTGQPSRIITIKEVQLVREDPTDTTVGVLFSADDGNVYQIFAGTQDGSVDATAITYPLPDLKQLPVEFRDDLKTFREVWIEGTDIPNWTISYSVNQDRSFVGPFQMLNRNKVGLTGRQIIIKFEHKAASSPGVTPLLSYMKINYDLQGQAQGGAY